MDQLNALDLLNAETQKLEKWYSLLGELSQSLWFSRDLPTMLGGFCKALVDKAGYSSAQVALEFDDKAEI